MTSAIHSLLDLRILLFDDQRGAGQKRANLIATELEVDVQYVWDVEHAIIVLRKQPFDLIVLDYLDLRGWGDARCGLDLVRRGVYRSLNHATPVIIYSLLAVPAEEANEVRSLCNLVSVRNQLMVDETIVASVAYQLGLPYDELRTNASLLTTVAARAVARVVEWSRGADLSRLVVPSWRADEEVIVDQAWWLRQPADVLSSFAEGIERITPDDPLLVRVEYNRDADDPDALNLRVIERIGLASRFRSELEWDEPMSVIDPEAPVDTPAGRRIEQWAAEDATKLEWQSIHRELEELYETDSDE